MFLPIGDSPNPERFTPYVTWGLIAANTLIFLFISLPLSGQPVQQSSQVLLDYVYMLTSQGVSASQIQYIVANTSLNDLFLFQYGYKPGAPTVISLFTSLFLHSGYMHLIGNMLFLYIYGDNVEHQLGRLRFLIMYLLSGVLATLCFALLADSSLTPLVGASGAISGVLGFYFYLFPKNTVKVFILLFPIFINVVQIPARIVLGIYVVLDNILPLFLNSGGNVAHGAHLGGFFAGLLIALIGERYGWQFGSGSAVRQFRSKGVLGSAKQKTERASDQQKLLIEAARKGDAEKVRDMLKLIPRNELVLLSMREIVIIVHCLEEGGYAAAAYRFLRIQLGGTREAAKLSNLYYELGRLRLKQGYPTAAYQHLLTGLDFVQDGETEGNLRRLLAQIRD